MGKVLLAMTVGYLLGRKKKAKLATAMGVWLIIRRLDINPQQLIADLQKELSDLPVVDEIRGEAKEELMKAVRTATGTVVSQVADNVAESLNRRTERLLHTDQPEKGPETGDEAEAKEEPEETSEAEAKEEPAAKNKEEPGEKAERVPSGRGRGRPGPPVPRSPKSPKSPKRSGGNG